MVGTGRIKARDITAEEVEHYHKHGWVKLEALISPDAAARLLAKTKEIMGVDVGNTAHPGAAAAGVDALKYNGNFRTYEPLAVDNATGKITNQLFFDFSHSPEIGRLCHRLTGHDNRYWVDGALVKMPRENSNGSAPTLWHADIGATDDTPYYPRASGLMFWIALTDMPAERGTMRFVGVANQSPDVVEIMQRDFKDPEKTYPTLEALGVLSPPLDLRAGDVTIHASSTYHSAPANSTDQPRWAYIVTVMPMHAVASEKPFWPMNGVEGIKAGEIFPDHRYRVLRTI